ncbi:nuclease-related domain-containing protein [Candidatus Chlorohelix sp.]|uniref:nuclease-related domain-containing protein n=1 Tax=Candidatus Chlorohelix sp. TaxID=3139201 RepID=UPI0030622B6C
MFVVTNKAELKKRIRNNRIMFWGGVAGLVGSMLTLLIVGSSPQGAFFIIIFGYPLLFLGIFLSKRGSYNNRRHAIGGYRLLSEEQDIERQLKSTPPRYHLYNYLNFAGISIEHMLVTPQGIILINMKGQQGRLKAGRDLYRMKRGFVNSIGAIGEPGIGNPSQELSRQCKRLRTWFEQKGFDIPTDGIVALNNPRANIESVSEMSFPVCMISDLREAVRQWQTELSMTAEEQIEIEKLLVGQLLQEEQAEALELLNMPAHKRIQLEREQELATEAARITKDKRKIEKKPGEKKPGASAVPQPGQRVGLNGKPLPPKAVEEKPRKAAVEPLKKPNPGAFGDPAKRRK